MQVHCVCVVRDEADILPFVLNSALEWAHAIYVLDNGSTDGTWDLLQSYAARERRIVVAGHTEDVFRNAMRGEVVNQVAHDAQAGDWWCRLDADEIYVGDPRPVLASTSSRYGLVYKTSIEYFFTDRDLEAYQADAERYTSQWTPDLIRYYRAWWSEIRFVRHLPGVPWDGAWPRGVQNLRGSPERVLVKHYQYRSPPQIERRLHVRRANTEARAFHHEKVGAWNPLGREENLVYPGPPAPGEPLWKSRVYRAEALHYDDGSGHFVVDSALLPPVQPGRNLLQRARHYVRNRFQR